MKTLSERLESLFEEYIGLPFTMLSDGFIKYKIAKLLDGYDSSITCSIYPALAVVDGNYYYLLEHNNDLQDICNVYKEDFIKVYFKGDFEIKIKLINHYCYLLKIWVIPVFNTEGAVI